MSSALVVAAHPDDEVLGCGGTIAQLADDGWNVSIVILGEGATSRSNDAALRSEVESLRSQAHRAAEVLGASSVELHDFPDNQFDTVPLLEITRAVETAIDAHEPTVVFCQSGGDLNIDHQLTFRAVLTATRPMSGCPVKEVYSFEVGSSTEWAFDQFAPTFRASVFYDISATLDRKLNAMSVYEGEIREFPHPRSLRALEAQATRWGTTVGLEAAEAFMAVRVLR